MRIQGARYYPKRSPALQLRKLESRLNKLIRFDEDTIECVVSCPGRWKHVHRQIASVYKLMGVEINGL